MQKKTKKALSMLLVVALIAVIAIGGMLAYLTSDDSDVNVMTMGNVKIAQHEYERVVDANGNYETITVTKADGTTQESYKLQEFTPGKPLYPVVGNPNGGYTSTYARFEQLDENASGGQAFLAEIKNGQDKLVLVENKGTSDAYVRTIFAFEMGSKSGEEWDNLIEYSTAATNEPWTMEYVNVAEIDGNNYVIYEAIYNGYSTGNMRHNGGILPAGEWTYNSLAEVYMTSVATNEDCEALDGNKNGTYDILVLSQAAQTAGFENAQTALDTAFGEVTAENAAKWFAGMEIPVVPVGYVVNNSDEFAAAVAAGETEIWLNAGEYDIKGAGGKTLTINGTEKAVLKVMNEGEDGCDYGFGAAGTGVGNITFNGVTIDTTANNGNYKGYAYMKGTFNDCNFVGAYSLNNANDFEFNNCTFDFKNGYFWTWSANSVSFDNCTFNGNSKTILVHGWASTKVNIKDCAFEATEKGYASGNTWTAAVEIDPAGTNTYEINFIGNNTKNENYADWTRIKDDSTGHTITGLN